MKKFLMTGAALAALTAAVPAMAADMAVRAPVYKAPPAPVVFSWNGFYLGLHAGYGWGDYTATTNIPTVTSLNPSGWLLGGQIGYNWQVAPMFVLGVEGDMAWANMDDSAAFGGYTSDTKINWTASLRARAGVAVDTMLIYATGGVAWAHNEASAVAGGTAYSADNTHTGWTIGAGIEWAFAPNWSAKVEYLYADYGSESYSFTPAIPGVITNVDLTASTVKLGVNYRFGGL